MKKDTTGYEPITFNVNVEAFRRFVERIQWFVLGAALLFGITVGLGDVTPLLIGLSSLSGLFLFACMLVTIRRRRYLYHFIGVILWGCVAAPIIGRIAGLRGDFDNVQVMGLSLLIPTLLVWVGRRRVMQFCRLDKETTTANP